MAWPSIWLPSTTGRRQSAAGDADVATVAVGPHVQQLDQVCSVAPGREALERDVARRRAAVHELDPDTVVVEGRVARQPVEPRGRLGAAPEHVTAVRCVGELVVTPGARPRFATPRHPPPAGRCSRAGPGP